MAESLEIVASIVHSSEKGINETDILRELKNFYLIADRDLIAGIVNKGDIKEVLETGAIEKRGNVYFPVEVTGSSYQLQKEMESRPNKTIKSHHVKRHQEHVDPTSPEYLNTVRVITKRGGQRIMPIQNYERP
ncbi:MAG: hypothetical protein ABH828_06375 [archaeon]